MSTISSDDLRAILAGCDGVTPGPWANGIHHRQETRDRDFAPIFANGVVPMAMVPLSVGGYQDPDGPRNAAHIARLDPQTVASIIAELLSLRESHPIEDGEGVFPTLEEAHRAAVSAAQTFYDAASVEETNWTGWGDQIVPFSAEMRRVKAEQALNAIRDADPSNPGTSKVENSRST